MAVWVQSLELKPSDYFGMAAECQWHSVHSLKIENFLIEIQLKTISLIGAVDKHSKTEI